MVFAYFTLASSKPFQPLLMQFPLTMHKIRAESKRSFAYWLEMFQLNGSRTLSFLLAFNEKTCFWFQFRAGALLKY